MTRAKEKKIEEISAIVLITALLIWTLYHLFSRPDTGTTIPNSAQPIFEPAVSSVASPTIVPVTLPASSSSGTPVISSCSCETSGCALSVNEIPTLAQILALGNAAASQIEEQGRSTIEAIGQIASNPLLTINYVQG